VAPRIDSDTAVLVGQTQEALGLAQVGPGEGAGEQSLHEAADVFSLLVGLAGHAVGVTHGVGRQFLRVVGAASAGGLARTRFDEFALVVDPHELAIPSHPNALAYVRCGEGINGLGKLDMVVWVGLALCPLRWIEALALKRLEGAFFYVLKDDKGTLTGGAMDTLTGNLHTPADCLALHVRYIDPLLAPKEILPDVGDVAFYVGFSLGVAGDGCVNYEATMASVLFEDPLEDWVVAVGFRYGRLEVVDHHPGTYPTKELPGVYPLGHSRCQRLVRLGP